MLSCAMYLSGSVQVNNRECHQEQSGADQNESASPALGKLSNTTEDIFLPENGARQRETQGPICAGVKHCGPDGAIRGLCVRKLKWRGSVLLLLDCDPPVHHRD